jgi:hypothetical protein
LFNCIAQPSSEGDIQALKEGTFYSFPNKPSNIKRLCLFECGHKYGDWHKCLNGLDGLLMAIAKTPIKHSLEEIDLQYCGLSDAEVRKHGFTKLKSIMTYSQMF